MPNINKLSVAGIEYGITDETKVPAPSTAGTNGQLLRSNGDGTTTWVDEGTPLPTMPTTDGTYTLKCTVSNGTATLTWETNEA